MTGETIEMILNAGAAFARRLWNAWKNKDQEEVRRLSDVLDEPLKSELAIRYQREMAADEFGGES